MLQCYTVGQLEPAEHTPKKSTLSVLAPDIEKKVSLELDLQVNLDTMKVSIFCIKPQNLYLTLSKLCYFISLGELDGLGNRHFILFFGFLYVGYILPRYLDNLDVQTWAFWVCLLVLTFEAGLKQLILGT